MKYFSIQNIRTESEALKNCNYFCKSLNLSRVDTDNTLLQKRQPIIIIIPSGFGG